MNKKKYQVFTPEPTVKRMLDEIGYFGCDIINKTIIDISCGDGAFLREAFYRYIAACKEKQMEPKVIFDMAFKHIFGFEIEKEPFNLCCKKINDILRKELNTSKCSEFGNIVNSDGLFVDESIKFDFVVGNPPYISYNEMNLEQRYFLRENFSGCKGLKYDYSYAFIEKSIKLCKENGIVCIITPINVYKIKSGAHIRNYVKSYLHKIIDVTEDNIFPGILTNPVISVFKKESNNNKICFIKNGKRKAIGILSFYNENTKQAKGLYRFGDYFSVKSGVATLLNKAFIVSKNNCLEKNVLKRACSPKFLRYSAEYDIIFPYKIKDDAINKYDEDEFFQLYPKTYNYLKTFKEELEKRDSDKGAKWFEYGRSQALNTINKRKIMIPAVATSNIRPIILNEDTVVYAGLIILEKDPEHHNLEEAINVLKGKCFYEYIKSFGVKMNGKSYRFGPKLLENFIVR